jgi:hypothetical protein
MSSAAYRARVSYSPRKMTSAPAFLPESWPTLAAFGRAALLLLLGLLLGLLVRAVCERVLAAARFDLLTARSGLDRFFRRNGINLSTARIFARLLQWVVFAFFLLMAIERLDSPATARLVENVIEYGLRLLIAFGILVFGLMGAAVLKDIVKNAAQRADVPFASMIGDIVYGAVFFFCGAAALDHLNIAREIVIIAFTVVFGSFCLALALAFGLGGQETARRWLDEMTRRREVAEQGAAAAAEVPAPADDLADPRGAAR